MSDESKISHHPLNISPATSNDLNQECIWIKALPSFVHFGSTTPPPPPFHVGLAPTPPLLTVSEDLVLMCTSWQYPGWPGKANDCWDDFAIRGQTSLFWQKVTQFCRKFENWLNFIMCKSCAYNWQLPAILIWPFRFLSLWDFIAVHRVVGNFKSLLFGDGLIMMVMIVASSADNSKSNLGVGISFQSQSIPDQNLETSPIPPQSPHS